MLRNLERWIWKGTLDLDWPASVEPAAELPTEFVDLAESASGTLQTLVAQAEAALAQSERRRKAEQAPQPNVPQGANSANTQGGDVEAELRRVAKAMLPSLDALDRIIEFGDSQPEKTEVFDNWLTSIKAMRTRMTRTMEGIGLSAIHSVGMEVDLEIHDVVAVAPAGNNPSNVVVAEQQRGYYFNGKPLREARVIVSQ